MPSLSWMPCVIFLKILVPVELKGLDKPPLLLLRLFSLIFSVDPWADNFGEFRLDFLGDLDDEKNELLLGETPVVFLGDTAATFAAMSGNSYGPLISNTPLNLCMIAAPTRFATFFFFFLT